MVRLDMETLYNADTFVKAELSGTRIVDTPVNEEVFEVRRATARPGLSFMSAVKFES